MAHLISGKKHIGDVPVCFARCRFHFNFTEHWQLGHQRVKMKYEEQVSSLRVKGIGPQLSHIHYMTKTEQFSKWTSQRPLLKKALSKGNKSMCHNDWPAAVGGQYPDMACFMRAWLPNQILMASSAQVDTKWHVAKVEIHQSWIVQMSPVHLGSLGLSDI